MFARGWTLNALLIVAIPVIAWLGGFFDSSRDAIPARTGNEIDTGGVAGIDIRSASVSLSLLRRGEDWFFADPLSWPANRAAVERLLAIVDVGDTSPLDDAGIDPGSLGLDSPVAEVDFDDIRIRFGIRNNIGGRRYTLIGPRLYLLPDLQLPFINQGLAGFVDRRLLPISLDAIEIRLPGAGIRRSEAGWEALAPATLSRQQAGELAAGWQALEASRVSAYVQAGSTPRPITASSANGARHDFLLLATSPEIVIANPGLGLQYHFNAGLVDRLLPPAADETPD